MYSSLPGEPGGRLEGLGEIAAPLLREEAEKRVSVCFCWGSQQDPLGGVPLYRGDESGFEALIPPVLPLPAQLGMLPLQPSLDRLENSLGCC